MKNNLGSSFNVGKTSIISNDIKNEDESDSIEEEELSYQTFCKMKKQIFQFIENNSAAKEKKKILALIKTYKHKI